MQALKDKPTKHTLKLLFGLTRRKQGSPLNLTVVMTIAKSGVVGVNERFTGLSSRVGLSFTG